MIGGCSSGWNAGVRGDQKTEIMECFKVDSLVNEIRVSTASLDVGIRKAERFIAARKESHVRFLVTALTEPSIAELLAEAERETLAGVGCRRQG